MPCETQIAFCKRDTDRFLQARGAGALALLGARIERHPDLGSTLQQCWEDNRHDSGNASETTREAPAHPAQTPLALQHLSNNPFGFTRAVLMAVWAHLPAYREDARALAMLHAGIQDRVWGVGRVAAEAAIHLQVSEPIARDLRQMVSEGAWDERARALRGLGHLASAGDTGSALFLLEQSSSADVTRRLLIAEALAQCSRCETEAALTALRELEAQSDSLTKPILQRALTDLQMARGSHGNVIASLLHLLGGDNYASQDGEVASKREHASARKAVSKDMEGRTAFLLLISVGTAKDGRENAGTLNALSEMAQNSPAYRMAQPEMALFSGPGYVGLLTFESAEAVFACATTITQAFKNSPLPRPRMAIHGGAAQLTKGGEGCWQIEGTGVDMARSIAGCAEPGHILVTPSAREALAADSQYHALLDSLGSCFVPQRGNLELFNLYDSKRGIGRAAYSGLKSSRSGGGSLTSRRAGGRKRRGPLARLLRAAFTLLLLFAVGYVWYSTYRSYPFQPSWQRRANSLLRTLLPPPSSEDTVRGKPSTPKKPGGKPSPNPPRTNPSNEIIGRLSPGSLDPHSKAKTADIKAQDTQVPASSGESVSVNYKPVFPPQALPATETSDPKERNLHLTLHFRLRNHKHKVQNRMPTWVRIDLNETASMENELDNGPLQKIVAGAVSFDLLTHSPQITVTPTVIYDDNSAETLPDANFRLPELPANTSRDRDKKPQDNTDGTSREDVENSSRMNDALGNDLYAKELREPQPSTIEPRLKDACFVVPGIFNVRHTLDPNQKRNLSRERRTLGRVTRNKCFRPY